MTSFWDVEYDFDICVRMNRVAAARRRAVERSTKWLTELPRVVLCGVLAVLWCADKFPCLSGDFSLLSVALRKSKRGNLTTQTSGAHPDLTVVVRVGGALPGS